MKRKPCIACGRVKPLTGFYRHPQMADGHLNRCKECQKALTQASRAARLEYYKEYDRQRDDLPHRVAARQAYQQTERGKERMNAGTKAWIARNPEKRAAHIWVNNAIKNGRLIRGPCEMCGATRVHAHHDDYDRPMEVRWFCRPCHTAHHKAEREASRNPSQK